MSSSVGSELRRDLYQLAASWEEADRADQRDLYPYRTVLDEVLFHAALRFRDYKQFREDGEFATRLAKWLGNLSNDRERRTLFRMLPWITFIDQQQMFSLYRDAYRRIIAPWIARGVLSLDDQLSAAYQDRLITELRGFSLHSITESFAFPDFLQVNSLAGLSKPRSFDEDIDQVPIKLPPPASDYRGIIVLEDFVGTGTQVAKVLKAVRQHAAPNRPILFVPLLILDVGVKTLAQQLGDDMIDFVPVMRIPTATCVTSKASTGDSDEIAHFRALVTRTGPRVLRRLNESDDPPKSPFGFKGSGAMLVTCHNTPNNTLPLIHHRAPTWFPLFRRLHHSTEGLS